MAETRELPCVMSPDRWARGKVRADRNLSSPGRCGAGPFTPSARQHDLAQARARLVLHHVRWVIPFCKLAARSSFFSAVRLQSQPL